MSMFEEIENLETAYRKQYPEEREERVIGALLFAFGLDRTTEILKERKSKKIKLITDPKKLDWLDFKYE